MLSGCGKNRELLNEVVEKLKRVEELSKVQRAARQNGDPHLAAELDRKLVLALWREGALCG